MACKKFKAVGELMLDVSKHDETEGGCFSADSWPVTGPKARSGSLGDVYRTLAKEYGRCTSKVYRDVDGGPPIEVGWVFTARRHYEDNHSKTYIEVVWVCFFRDAECECCGSRVGRMDVTLGAAREMLAKEEKAAA